MLPWASEPDMWISVKDFCRLFNYSYKSCSVFRRLLRTGALADFGIQSTCIIIPGKSNFAKAENWYIRLKD